MVFVTALSGYRHARWLCQHNTAPDVCVCRARASKLQQAQTQRDRSPAPGVRLWRVCADTAHSLGTPHRGLARAHTCMFRCTHRKGHTETWSGHRVSRPTVRRFAHVSLPGRWAHHLVWCVRQYKGHSTHVATEPSTTTEQATRALTTWATQVRNWWSTRQQITATWCARDGHRPNPVCLSRRASQHTCARSTSCTTSSHQRAQNASLSVGPGRQP